MRKILTALPPLVLLFLVLVLIPRDENVAPDGGGPAVTPPCATAPPGGTSSRPVSASVAEPTRAQLLAWLERLGDDDFAVWNDAVKRLSGCVVTALDPLIETMRARADDPEFCSRAGIVLKTLGPRRGRALAGALERVEEPLPLQTLIDVVGALGENLLQPLDAVAQLVGVASLFDPAVDVHRFGGRGQGRQRVCLQPVDQGA